MSSAIGPRRGLTVRPLQPVLGDVFDPEANPLVSIGQIARKPGMPLLIVVSCVFAFAFNGINSTLSKYISEKFSVTAAQIAVVFVVGGLVTAIVQASLVQRLVKKFGEKTMTIVSLLGLGLGILFV